MPSGRRAGPLAAHTLGGRAFDVANGAFMIVIAVTFLYPLWNTFIISLSTLGDASALGFHVWLREWSFDSYLFSFSQYGKAGIAYANSVLRTVAGTVLIVVVTLAGAYPLAKKRLPGRSVMTTYLLITIFFNGGLIPTYLLVRSLGLIDTRWVYLLPIMANGFYIILTRNFLMTIDEAYEEAALMDGANYLQILVRVIAPLAMPIVATVGLWAAVQHWNAWFDALIYTSDPSKVVLQLLLRRVLREEAFQLEFGMQTFEELSGRRPPTAGIKAAITIITIGPIIIIYPFFQRFFVRGIYLGSLK